MVRFLFFSFGRERESERKARHPQKKAKKEGKQARRGGGGKKKKNPPGTIGGKLFHARKGRRLFFLRLSIRTDLCKSRGCSGQESSREEGAAYRRRIRCSDF